MGLVWTHGLEWKENIALGFYTRDTGRTWLCQAMVTELYLCRCDNNPEDSTVDVDRYQWTVTFAVQLHPGQPTKVKSDETTIKSETLR